MSWFTDRLKEYETTVAGVVLGAGAATLITVKSGQVSKEALIAAAALGGGGALLKTPTWARVFGRAIDERPGVDEINRRIGGEPPQQ